MVGAARRGRVLGDLVLLRVSASVFVFPLVLVLKIVLVLFLGLGLGLGLGLVFAFVLVSVSILTPVSGLVPRRCRARGGAVGPAPRETPADPWVA